jgi:mono/diheme cytochrome c family protein
MKPIINKSLGSLLFLLAISMSSVSCASEDEITDPIAHGEKAHKNHCYKCHGDEMYTRENRFVKSIDALSQQVLRCKDGSDVPWFDEDADAVVQFLNKKYYRF